MSALSESASQLDRRAAQLLELLREELAPYPGRAEVVVRIIIASAVVMILVMTFRIPGAALAGYYTLLLSREDPRGTLAAAVELILSFGAGVGYVLLGALLCFGSPVLHFLWVVGSFFIIFYGIRVLRSYSAAAGFGFLIATCIPVWDRAQSPELSVEATLWTAGSVALGAAVTVGIEYLWTPFQRHNPFEEGLFERWRAVGQTLRAMGHNENAGEPGRKLTQFAAVGTSRLRRTVLRSGRGVDYIEPAATVLSITEHLVDLVASLMRIHARVPHREQERLLRTAALLGVVELSFTKGTVAEHEAQTIAKDAGHSALPLLPEIERNVAMLLHVLYERDDLRSAGETSQPLARPSLFIHDAWKDPDHLRFALKGSLAATICYVAYSAIGWPGLSTSVATCIVTALSSIGSSRQKQILRISGAITGGVIFGMGAQAFLLPHIDSITAFTLLFVTVTGIAAWISTSSARLSYFGLQMALAFFLLNLQEFAFQTSPVVARDRVFGILLGLLVMWVIFDLLGGVRAADQMLRRFRRGVMLLAKLQELSLASNAQTIARRAREIREELIGIFAAVNTEADGVLLETGRQRRADMLLRDRVLTMQPVLRSLLLLQVTALQYRKQKLLHELPETIGSAQRDFDTAVADFLRDFAANFPAKPASPASEPFYVLRDRIYRYYEDTSGDVPSAAALAILSLSELITLTLRDLAHEPSSLEQSSENSTAPGAFAESPGAQ